MVPFGKVPRYSPRHNSDIPRIKETRLNRGCRDRDQATKLLQQASSSDHSNPERQQHPSNSRRTEGRLAPTDCQDSDETVELTYILELEE